MTRQTEFGKEMPTPSNPPPSNPPPTVDRHLLDLLRDDLSAAGFTVDGVTEALGPLVGDALAREQTLPAELATQKAAELGPEATDGLVTEGAAAELVTEGAAAELVTEGAAAGLTTEGAAAGLVTEGAAAGLATQGAGAGLTTEAASDPVLVLVRLFALGKAVPATRVRAAAPTVGVDGLVALGVARLDGDMVSATCDLRPYADDAHAWWVASDLSENQVGEPLHEDHVLGIGGASTTLASWTPRPEVATALDLGTGSGVQALHLASHVATIVATDTSARALAFAGFNAALAGLDLDLRRGSMLEPVRGERFDLVVSNPPFVITPRDRDVPLFEYRDGGRVGDAVVEHLVRSVGEHLAPGGIAQLLGNWEIPRGADWRDRVGGWLAGTGLDAWVVQRDVQDPAQYAETWARDGGHRPGTTAHARLYAAWLADFAARDVASIGFGVITVQRPATPRDPWQELVELTGAVAAPMGPSVLAGLRARTWLAEHGDAGLLATSWRCAQDVTEERHGRPGAPDPDVIVVRQGGGLGRAFRIDTVMAALLSVCDGELAAGQALGAIAELLGLDPAQARAGALPTLRELVADGLLV